MANLNIYIEDNIAVKDKLMTCGSELLSDYISPYDSTISKRLKEKSYNINVIKSAGEFGLLKHGSTADILTEKLESKDDVIIGLDRKGEFRVSASKTDKFGFTPTQGAVSRYGVFSPTSSYDNVSIMANSINFIREVFDQIVGIDKKDLKTVEVDRDIKNITDLKIGKFCDLDIYKENKDIVEISIDHRDYLLDIFKIISSVEYSTNTGRFDGIRYGHRGQDITDLDSLYKNTRGEYLGDDAIEEILLGYYFLNDNRSDYYDKAISIRKEFIEGIQETFKNIDILITPMHCSNCPEFKSTLLANTAGLPSINIKINNKDYQLIGKKYSDLTLLEVAQNWEVIE